MIPPETVPMLTHEAPRSILDSPRWAWIEEARAAGREHRETPPNFSTFEQRGIPEPDTWPDLPSGAWEAWLMLLFFLTLIIFLTLFSLAVIERKPH